MLQIDGVDLFHNPSLLQIAEANDDYEMMAILINDKNYNKIENQIANLNQVKDNKCVFRSYIDDKSVKFLCALISSPKITLSEQY